MYSYWYTFLRNLDRNSCILPPPWIKTLNGSLLLNRSLGHSLHGRSRLQVLWLSLLIQIDFMFIHQHQAALTVFYISHIHVHYVSSSVILAPSLLTFISYPFMETWPYTPTPFPKLSLVSPWKRILSQIINFIKYFYCF